MKLQRYGLVGQPAKIKIDPFIFFQHGNIASEYTARQWLPNHYVLCHSEKSSGTLLFGRAKRNQNLHLSMRIIFGQNLQGFPPRLWFPI